MLFPTTVALPLVASHLTTPEVVACNVVDCGLALLHRARKRSCVAIDAPKRHRLKMERDLPIRRIGITRRRTWRWKPESFETRSVDISAFLSLKKTSTGQSLTTLPLRDVMVPQKSYILQASSVKKVQTLRSRAHTKSHLRADSRLIPPLVPRCSLGVLGMGRLPGARGGFQRSSTTSRRSLNGPSHAPFRERYV